MSASSLTPRSSTVWLTMGMPASTRRAQAARAAVRQFARMVGVQRHEDGLRRRAQRGDQRLRDALGIARPARACASAAPSRAGCRRALRVTSAMRRGDRMNGSPPVRITSQIAGCRARCSRAPRQVGSPTGPSPLPGPDHLAAEAEAAVDRADARRSSAARGRGSGARCRAPGS